MKSPHIRAYFAGDKSQQNIELALQDAKQAQSFWRELLETTTDAVDTVIDNVNKLGFKAASEQVAFFSKRLRMGGQHAQ